MLFHGSAERFATIVVGAGPAGLTAAIYLARFNRRCLVLHASDSRASYAPQMLNTPGYPEGVSGAEFLARLRQQAGRAGALIRTFEVEEIRETANGFSAISGMEIVSGKTLLLATGVEDLGPPIAGVAEGVERGIVRLCPVCDGYETTDRHVAVVGEPERCLKEARFLRHFGAVTAILGAQLDENNRHDAAKNDISVHDDIADIAFLPTGLRVTCVDGLEMDFDFLYAAYGTIPRAELAAQLQLEQNPEGYLETNQHMRTSRTGVWAAGDVVHSLSQISVACGQAAIAATDIHNFLLERTHVPRQT